jgi:hypothetical protein
VEIKVKTQKETIIDLLATIEQAMSDIEGNYPDFQTQKAQFIIEKVHADLLQTYNYLDRLYKDYSNCNN